MTGLRAVAVIGAGEIGSGWAALFAAHAGEVRVADPDPRARDRVARAIAAADATGVASRAEAVRFEPDAAAAAEGAEWVQESAPEDLALKRALLRSMAPVVGEQTIVASSSSSFTAAELGTDLPYAARFLLAHPLHPVFAVPVVEIGPGAHTSASAVERASSVMRALDREPIVVREEPRGLIANRLTAALLREAIDLVARGATDAASLDRIVEAGVATGWMAAGVFGTERAGSGETGEAAARRVLTQLAPILPELAGWTKADEGQKSALVAALGGQEAAGQTTGQAPDGERWAALIARLLAARRG